MFGGQEMAGALADVLTGKARPAAGCPRRSRCASSTTPAARQLPGENGEVRYGEGVLVGYRWYDARHLPSASVRPPAFSHASFEIGEPRVGAAFTPGGSLTVEVDVTNTSDRPGAEVVQLYVEPPPSELVRPPRELRAFDKVHLEPGETTTVALTLTDRAFACWDPEESDWESLRPRAAVSPMIRADEERRTTGGWRIDPGTYVLHVGRSSADLPRDCDQVSA